MNPLVQEFLVTILRKLLTIGATWLVAQGFLGEGDVEKYAAGFALLLVSLLWSLWSRYKDRIHFLMALESMPGTPEPDVKAKAAKFPPAVLAILLAASLSSGCAGKTAPVLVAQTALGLSQSIGQLQVAAEQLQRSNVLDVRTALTVQEKLLLVNTRLAQIVPILKAIDAVQQQGVKPTLGDIDSAMALIVLISQQISTISQGVPISDTTRAFIDLIQTTQQSIALTMVEIARLRAALER